MENKWAYLGMNLCWIFSFLFAYSGATVCNLTKQDFGGGVVVGMSYLTSRLLALGGFLFLSVIIKNNTKKEKKKYAPNKK